MQHRTNPVILAVDDKPDNLILLETLLSKYVSGCRFISSATAREGLALADKDPPDVFLIDVQMPGIDGIEMCRRIKTASKTAHIPVILMTANHAPAHLKVKGLEAGTDDFVSKPIDNTELIARVKAMLRIKQAEDQLQAERDRLKANVSEQNLRLTSAEDRYRTLFNSVSDAIFILDETGRFLEVNDEACRRLGYARDELLHKSPYDINSPEMAEEVARKMKTSFAQGEAVFETVHVSREGWRIPSELNARAIIYEGRKAMLVTARDVSERRNTLQVLRESEARYRALFDHVTDGLAVYRPTSDGEDFILVDINQAGEKIDRASRDKIVGRRLLDIYPGVKEFGLFDMLKRVNESGVPEHHPIGLYEDERIRGWRENFVYKLPSGEIAALYADKTEHKAMEEEREKLQAQLQQSQKMEAIGALAGGIAHDFNNILYPILGYTEMAIEQIPEGGRVRKYLEEVLVSVRRATELVRQILSFSRSESAERRPFKIQPIIKESIKLLRASIPTTIDIRHDIDTSCGPISGDPTEIHQIMMNLCTNAYHAMEDSGGTIHIRLVETRVTSGHLMVKTGLVPGPYLLLSVSDTGSGIPSDIIEQVFEPYFTTKAQGKGTGLGLAVVYRIVKNCGGDILVESEPGRGTRFDLYFPTIRVQMEEVHAAQPETLVEGGPEQILLVDDESHIIAMLSRMLSRLGYKVASCADGVEALELFQQQPDRFDLVITDMTMPRLRGDQLALKLLNIRPDIPIIICTGHSDAIDDDTALAAGFKALIMKPVSKKEMARAIRKALGRHGKETS